MNTFFIRHTVAINIDYETRQKLWRERRIAIHYPQQKTGRFGRHDLSSLNPDDYAGPGRRSIKTLLQLASEGGYVCAQHYPEDKWMLGLVKPNSKVELFKGSWHSPPQKGKRTAILKTLRLTQVKLVDPLEFAVLSVGRPRQGTITRWHLAGNTVERLITGRRRKTQLSDLSYPQQEMLCAEFLRLPQAAALGLPRLAHLLLPPGRTMKDIDRMSLVRRVSYRPWQSQ